MKKVASLVLGIVLLLTGWTHPPAGHSFAQATGNEVVAPTTPHQTQQRRRIYLMRHGDVNYFDAIA